MSTQALGVVTDTKYVVLTPGEEKLPAWVKYLIYGAVGLGALLILTKSKG